MKRPSNEWQKPTIGKENIVAEKNVVNLIACCIQSDQLSTTFFSSSEKSLLKHDNWTFKLAYMQKFSLSVKNKNYLFCRLGTRIATCVYIVCRSDEIHAHAIVFGKYWIVFRQNDGKTVRVIVGQQTPIVVAASGCMTFWTMEKNKIIALV